jgi:hypothetical protein
LSKPNTKAKYIPMVLLSANNPNPTLTTKNSPAFEIVPAAHAVKLESPVEAQYCPEGHVEQTDAPELE